MNAGPLLRPRAWRVAAFFAGSFLAVAGPTAAVWVAILLGPPAYVLDRSALAGWRGTQPIDGVSIEAREYPTAAAARGAASDLFERTAASSRSRGPGAFRLRRSDAEASELILVIDNVAIVAEGPDAASIERVVGRLPFLSPNPRSPDRWLSALVDRHLAALLAWIAAYAAVVGVAMFQAGSWAARIDPPPDAPRVPAEAMKQRLLAVNDLDAPVLVRQNARGDFVAEWRLADARWAGVFEKGGLSISHSVKLRLDEARHAVRAIDISRRLSWSGGLPRAGLSFSFFRGIVFYEFEAGAAFGLLYRDGQWRVDHAYRYSYNLNELKQPLVEAVVSGGWVYRPVAFFLPLLG